MEAALFPVGTNASTHGIPGLDPNSFTAHKLKHATPEHLHLTTRRFFIGPIPEGWLSSNRKSWYRRRLELSSYSSKAATFHAAAGQTHHHRTATGLDHSNTARMSYGFPQPEDVEETSSERSEDAEDTVEEEDDEDDDWQEARELEPVSTVDDQAFQEVAGQRERSTSPRKLQELPPPNGLDGQSEDISPAQSRYHSPQSTFTTSRQGTGDVDIQVTGPDSSEAPLDGNGQGSPAGNRLSATNTTSSSLRHNGLDVQQSSLDAGSRTALLPASRPQSKSQPKSRDGAKSLKAEQPMPDSQEDQGLSIKKTQSAGVRFKVGDGLADRKERVGRKVDRARTRVGGKLARRQTLQDGTIVKMEKMLVRIDTTIQQIPADFDENGSMRTETKLLDKWKEYMVVARKSSRNNEEDFRLQLYNTRVIPEIDDTTKSKKPAREVKLIRKTTHVNLFSSLDKSLVVWHPYKKGTRILVMKCESSAHSVEWYTFLRDALGWKRPETLQVAVPGLDVALQVERPFQELAAAVQDAEDEETAMIKAEEAEQAVAGKIINQCIEMLRDNPEWSSVIQNWQASFKPGLAWKRYDRLEWIHGVNEQKMYGTMAMQHSYDLELRPKVHYPQTAFGRKGKEHEEPAPVEGFLIRMTSQKGIHKRMGKTFFKRLYFSTQDHLLVFNRPAQATPPHPPRLQTINTSDIPTAREIVDKTPIMYEINPYALNDEHSQIKWLTSDFEDRINRGDREAYEEARRNHANLSASEGYINMTRIRKVRKMKWGADDMDEGLSSGSDVDFHESVPDTSRHDGTTQQIDDNRVFELLLDNGLIVRLQAFDQQTRDEWLSRLKKLVKYWKLRKEADMNIFKQIRVTNLQTLKIDEDVEAELGQFGHKWEVTRSEASPQLYNVCSISNCRTISLSGLLYRKARRHGTFQRCGVVLAGGRMLIYQSTLRKSSGAQVPNIHQDKQQVIDLKGCYIYSGLIVEDDLLYQNRTFDANHMGTMASLPRVWTEDGWTSTDVDVMCCFVIWQNTRKSWFRTAGDRLFTGGGNTNNETDAENDPTTKKARGHRRAKIKRVRQLGVPGRGMVFKCRSRAERDLWVLNLSIEIERLVEQQRWEAEAAGEDEVRFAG